MFATAGNFFTQEAKNLTFSSISWRKTVILTKIQIKEHTAKKSYMKMLVYKKPFLLEMKICDMQQPIVLKNLLISSVS